MNITTKEEADEAMAALRRYYKESVLPVSEMCDAIFAWAEAAQDYLASRGHKYDVEDLRLCADKSNMLARLIYGREKLRTEKCPKHKGHWSGIPAPRNNCECGLTGWLPATPTDPTEPLVALAQEPSE